MRTDGHCDSDMEETGNPSSCSSSDSESYSGSSSSDVDMVEGHSDDDEHIRYFDIGAALSTCDRDYLVRSNGDRVKVTSLEGKIVLLFTVALPMRSGSEADLSLDLAKAYDKLYRRGDFEVVMVARMRAGKRANQVSFDQCFSNLPWLAVPFEDSESRARLYRSLGNPLNKFKIIDGNGRVMGAHEFDLLLYGIEICYPFTAKRMQEIYDEDRRVLRENRSLETLLVIPTRDFVVSIQDGSHRVLISDLKNKLVGLYLCHYNVYSSDLQNVYNQCRARGQDVEIVLAYVEFEDIVTQEDYDEYMSCEFQNMPWLALPFWDKRSRRRLWNAFNRCPWDMFVVMGPNGAFVDSYAGDVIREYGIEAYPFTREKVVYNEVTRLQALTLESLLVYKGRDYVIRKDGAQFPVASLKGRNIILYFDSSQRRSRRLLCRLTKWYVELKAKDDGFEVVYVPFTRNEALFDRHFSLMPWLAVAYDSDLFNFWRNTLNGLNCNTLLWFGSDGRLLTTEIQEYLKDRGSDAYPFTDCDLFGEIERELSDKHNWFNDI